MKNFTSKFLGTIAVALSITACSSNEWTVKGDIEGGEGHLLTLEASSNGGWYMLDSLTLKSDKFDFSQPAAGYPDIYRLAIDGKYIYFPVDSIETVSLKTSLDKFGSEYTLEGSDATAMIMEVEKRVAQVVNTKGEYAVAIDDSLKRDLAKIIIANPSGIVAYYIINKKIGKTPIFNASVKSDLRIIGAVANAYTENRPNDPRTEYLKNLYLANKAMYTNYAKNDTVVVGQTHIFDINLNNPDGKKVSLANEATKGKVILLNFTSMTADESPAFNIELAKIYNEYKDRGFEIYQVSVDEDEYAWQKAAKNLPWISVYAGVDNPKCLIEYNVNFIPALYVINRNGEISERITDITKIKSTISKYL